LANIFINDLFWTLQGEGRHWGRRALFVRMPYCNLSCTWCDTKFDTHKPWSEEDFNAFAMKEKARFAVVTGGEPLMHKHTPKVVELLHAQMFDVAVETNGTFATTIPFDWITCSPKSQANFAIHEDLYERVDEFKYVVDKDFDFKVLDRHKQDDHNEDLQYSLSPEFGEFNVNVTKIIEFIQENPKWKLSLQTHKWLGIP